MRILIVDDEKNIRDSLKKYLSLESIDAETAESGEAALSLLEDRSFDAAVLDLKLPGMSGQELLEQIMEKGFPVPVIMISAHGEINDAIRALKSGARDYLVKPFDPAELVIKLGSLVENKRRENVLEAESRSRAVKQSGNRMIGESRIMKELSARIDKLAASDVTVLLTGESGTGKEVAAREIHSRSPNSTEPFAAVNIGGIHESLMESELFGHEKGSFTGAVGRRQGLFELAGRGSIFLDEIGEMPMSLQVKLLRVLQERKIRRLGGIVDIPVNARIISATNRNVEALVKEGKFREDLYYRLNVFRIALPPLRDRRDDIPPLAESLTLKLCSRMGRPLINFSSAAMNKLLSYDFPGNVRELENILERALIFCESSVIEPVDIDIHETSDNPVIPEAFEVPKVPVPDVSASPSDSTNASESTNVTESLDSIEKTAILAALERCGGNRTKAAAELGITRKTIVNKLKLYGISDKSLPDKS
jgi:two-component system response regulator AtoC